MNKTEASASAKAAAEEIVIDLHPLFNDKVAISERHELKKTWQEIKARDFARIIDRHKTPAERCAEELLANLINLHAAIHAENEVLGIKFSLRVLNSLADAQAAITKAQS